MEAHRASGSSPAAAGGTGAVALQCVTSVVTTLLAQALGPTLAGQIVAGVVATLLGAFLVAPTKHRTHRFVAVALVVALFEALGFGGSKEEQPGTGGIGRAAGSAAFVPASWAAVGLAATVGFLGGSAITTARDGWKPGPGPEVVMVKVPRVHGQSATAARKQLVGRGFRVTVKARRSERVAEGRVVRTEPPGHTKIEQGSPVTIVVSAGRKLVRVPVVSGRSGAEAMAALRRHDLVVDPNRERSEEVSKGDAIGTDPPAGTSIEKGSTVTLTISNWYTVLVPELVGLSEWEASSILDGLSLSLSADQEETLTAPRGVVTAVYPPAGERVEGDSTVSVTVADHEDKDCADFDSQAEAQAYFDALEALEGSAEDEDDLDGDGDGQVCE